MRSEEGWVKEDDFLRDAAELTKAEIDKAKTGWGLNDNHLFKIEEEGNLEINKAMCREASTGDAAAVRSYLRDGANPNGVYYGWSALIWAARNNHVACMEALCDYGADLDWVDSGGWTPLIAAASNGHTAAVDWLLDRGVAPPRKAIAKYECAVLTKEGLIVLSEGEEAQIIWRPKKGWLIVRTKSGKIGEVPSPYFDEPEAQRLLGGSKKRKYKKTKKKSKKRKSKRRKYKKKRNTKRKSKLK